MKKLGKNLLSTENISAQSIKDKGLSNGNSRLNDWCGTTLILKKNTSENVEPCFIFQAVVYLAYFTPRADIFNTPLLYFFICFSINSRLT